MGRLEVACRRFAVLSGIRQEPDNYATCVYPKAMHGQRRGMLAVVTEPSGYQSALASDASRLVHEVVVRHYFGDTSLTLTSGLLKALDSANTSLLEYNYSSDLRPASGDWQMLPTTQPGVAVQAGGVRTRRTQVGLTAVLLHPDGAGVYLAQMSPTQAYVVHNGVLSALPEPKSWQPLPGKVAVTLRRVPNPGEEDYDEYIEDLSQGLTPMSLPALPLGSGTEVDVVLLYRRVEPGDLIAIVSTSLARHLDRSLAEEVFSSLDADAVVDALYTLATERGLAQSHACVLQLGVQASSGVDEDFTFQVAPAAHVAPGPEVVATNGGTHHAPDGDEHPQWPGSGLIDMLKAPRQWFGWRKASNEVALEHSSDGDPSTERPAQEEAFPEEALHPTQVLLHHILEVPPYKSGTSTTPQLEEELQFDGWVDVPPVLGNAQQEPYLRDIALPQPPPDASTPERRSEIISGSLSPADLWREQAEDGDANSQYITPPGAGQSRGTSIQADGCAGRMGKPGAAEHAAGTAPQRGHDGHAAQVHRAGPDPGTVYHSSRGCGVAGGAGILRSYAGPQPQTGRCQHLSDAGSARGLISQSVKYATCRA